MRKPLDYEPLVCGLGSIARARPGLLMCEPPPSRTNALLSAQRLAAVRQEQQTTYGFIIVCGRNVADN